MNRRTAGVVVPAILALSTASMAAGVVLGIGSPTSLLASDPLFFVALGVALAAVGAVGALLAWRLPGNAFGWVLLGVYTLAGGLGLATEYANSVLVTRPGSLSGTVAAWFANWLWFPLLGLLLVYVPLLFPTGRPPSPRWRVVGWAGGVGIAAVAVNSALAETLRGDGYEVANWIGVAGVVTEEGPVDVVGTALLIGALAGAVASAVVRFRRARGVERQQLKWMVFAAALLALMIVVETLPVPLPQQVGDLPFAVTVAFLPIAIGISVLRYRLYEIDRIISRTVSYGLLTALLGAIYLGGVLLVAPLVGEGSGLAVAGSTLAVAAAFQALRRRVQSLVDRRFNRSRYDAQRTVEAFAARLRDEVDLDELRAELVGVVRHSVQPAGASLWLREVTLR